ncbi:MAG TPA: hypothetical protein VEB00_08170 [Clostridia bacterium]|nr:hypothetical protein [Clostridia bacterium]
MRLNLIFWAILLSMNSVSWSEGDLIDKANDILGSNESVIIIETKDESVQVVDLINSYEISFVEAVNHNDFSLVEPYLAVGSSLYDSQKKLVHDLYIKGIKEKYVSHEIGFLYYDSSSSYEVEVIETINIAYPGKGESNKDFQWIYTVNKIDNKLKLSQIVKWESFEKDIELRKSNARPDEFYLYWLYESYEAELIDLLNNGNSQYLSGLFNENSVKTQHDALINSLKAKGKEFSLVKTEYLKHWSTSNNPYTGKKKTTLSYVDENSCKRELNLYITLTVEVSRSKDKLSFGGYARITKVEYLIE